MMSTKRECAVVRGTMEDLITSVATNKDLMVLEWAALLNAGAKLDKAYADGSNPPRAQAQGSKVHAFTSICTLLHKSSHHQF